MQLNARVSGGRPRVALEALGTLLCAAMLVTAFVLAAVAEPPHTEALEREVDLSGVLPPGDQTDPGVRALPLLDPDGPVVATFPQGAGLDDPAQVQAVLHSLAGRLGLDLVIDSLLATPLEDPDLGGGNDLDLYQGYPYQYVTLDPIIDEWLTAEAVQADPEAVLDLAGLLLLDATRSQRESDYEHDPNSWAGVAYSLLRRARDLAPSCDVQLQLTFVLSMGYAPHIQDVEAESGRAVEACPDDRTPLWLLGQVQSVQASLIESFFKLERGPRAMAARRRGHLRRAAGRVPGLAAGLGRRRGPAPAARRRGRTARPAAVPGPVVATRRAGGVRRGAASLGRPGAPGRLGPGAVGERRRRRGRRRPGRR